MGRQQMNVEQRPVITLMNPVVLTIVPMVAFGLTVLLKKIKFQSEQQIVVQLVMSVFSILVKVFLVAAMLTVTMGSVIAKADIIIRAVDVKKQHAALICRKFLKIKSVIQLSVTV